MAYVGPDIAGPSEAWATDLLGGAGDAIIQPSVSNVAAQASDVATTTRPSIRGSLARHSIGDTQEYVGPQSVVDIKGATVSSN